MNKGHIRMVEIPVLSHLSLPPGHSSAQNAWFLISPEVPVSLGLSKGPPLFTRCVISCHLARAPLSLLISRPLPALTVEVYLYSLGCDWQLWSLGYVANIRLAVSHQSPEAGWSCLSKSYLTLGHCWQCGAPGPGCSSIPCRHPTTLQITEDSKLSLRILALSSLPRQGTRTSSSPAVSGEPLPSLPRREGTAKFSG